MAKRVKSACTLYVVCVRAGRIYHPHLCLALMFEFVYLFLGAYLLTQSPRLGFCLVHPPTKRRRLRSLRSAVDSWLVPSATNSNPNGTSAHAHHSSEAAGCSRRSSPNCIPPLGRGYSEISSSKIGGDGRQGGGDVSGAREEGQSRRGADAGNHAFAACEFQAHQEKISRLVSRSHLEIHQVLSCWGGAGEGGYVTCRLLGEWRSENYLQKHGLCVAISFCHSRQPFGSTSCHTHTHIEAHTLTCNLIFSTSHDARYSTYSVPQRTEVVT